jgi:probable HAF family extracellular repeat protein
MIPARSASASITRIALVFLLGSAAAAATWGAPTRYHLQDLGPLSGAWHLNASAEAAGQSYTQDQPAVWIDGVETDLANFSGFAGWVNDAGAVVGLAPSGAAYWSNTGVLTELGVVAGWEASQATSINNGGDCIARALVAAGWRSFLLPGCTGSGAIDLGSFGDTVFAEAINDRGQIAGSAATQQDGRLRYHAFFYADGQMMDLGVLRGFVQSKARDLNVQGHVVGSLFNRDNYETAFFWDGEKLKSLGTFGGHESIAYAVNDADVIVGTYQTANFKWHPFILDKGTPGGKMKDLTKMLDESGDHWKITTAVDINNAGQILVQGHLGHDVADRSAVLTPID